MNADQQAASQASRGSDAEMNRVLVRGFAIGVPAAFVVTMVIASLAGIGWSASAVVAAWGAIVGGPFFGTALLMKQVAALDAGCPPVQVRTATPAGPPHRLAA